MTNFYPTIADVFPELSPEEQQAAKCELDEYIRLIVDIYEEICADPDLYANFQLLRQEYRHRFPLPD